jgi:hypothetical protein
LNDAGEIRAVRAETAATQAYMASVGRGTLGHALSSSVTMGWFAHLETGALEVVARPLGNQRRPRA